MKTSSPKTISAADFKAKCLELMDTVARTGASITVTKRGRPVAVLSPVRTPGASARGFMKGKLHVLGDITSPIDVKWEADA
ncbi:MAG: type II toxin-antitoxin system Phd/YefM family antitoxin [Deltaproteobacteria bacterium]|nr:type II toxin-antitoxin system Phd/YefM family antitoxin [Deltaproteobacteria bacterium]